MKGCPEYEEILLLDLYGELDPGPHARWRSHLAACPACEAEMQRMRQLVGEVRVRLTPPPLGTEATDRLVRAARESLVTGRKSAWSGWSTGWRWLSGPWRFSTALATVCLFAALISVFTLGNFQGFLHQNGSSGQERGQKLAPEELEIIRNLDLLKQFDSLQRLVQTLDEPDGDSRLPEPAPSFRGVEKS